MRDLNKLPVPEIIDGKEWDVGEAIGHHAGTNVIGHEMFVPIEDDCERCGLDHDRYIRCHELTHARYSKDSPGKKAQQAGVSAEAYALAEENFIEAIVGRSYPDLDPAMCVKPDGSVHEVRDKVVMGIRNGNVEHAARLTIAAASGMLPLPEDGRSLIPATQEAEREIYNAYHSFSQSLRYSTFRQKYTSSNIKALAGRIERFLSQVDEAAAQDRKDQKENKEGKKKAPSKAKGSATKPGGHDEEKFRAGRNLSRKLSWAAGTSSGPAKWGKMEIQIPPRPINLNKKFGIRKYRASPEGARVRNMSRYFSDEKVFGRKRRYKGGTLLVDGSGSMSFSQQDLEAIVQRIPAATIAIYGGYSTSGILRLIVRGGTCVETKFLQTPGGNVVDGPALDWLGKQRGPRLWLSDGGVCVDGSDDPGDLVGDASAKCRKYNVRRVRWLEQAEKAFDNPAIGVRSSLYDDRVDVARPHYEPEEP